MAILYEPNGEKTKISPKSKKDGFRLEELYKLLECRLVEVLYLPNDEIMIVDEEFLLKNDPILNVEATKVASNGLGYYQPICGHAIVCKNEEFK